jgi:hypothetical protein
LEDGLSDETVTITLPVRWFEYDDDGDSCLEIGPIKAGCVYAVGDGPEWWSGIGWGAFDKIRVRGATSEDEAKAALLAAVLEKLKP